MVRKFVITSDGTGVWRRGDVISEEDIKAAGGGVDRLLNLKAMRQAFESETEVSHVEMPDVLKEASFQERQAQDKEMIFRLEAEIRELQARLQVPVPAVDQHASMAAIVEQKDRTLADLNAKLVQLPTMTREIHELRGQKADLEAKNQQLEARLKALQMQATPAGDMTEQPAPAIPAGPDLQANAEAAAKRLKEITGQQPARRGRPPIMQPGQRVSAEEAAAQGATVQ